MLPAALLLAGLACEDPPQQAPASPPPSPSPSSSAPPKTSSLKLLAGEVHAGGVASFSATLEAPPAQPEDVTFKASYTTTDTAVLDVEAPGKIRGNNPGNAWLKATLGGQSKDLKIHVRGHQSSKLLCSDSFDDCAFAADVGAGGVAAVWTKSYDEAPALSLFDPASGWASFPALSIDGNDLKIKYNDKGHILAAWSKDNKDIYTATIDPKGDIEATTARLSFSSQSAALQALLVSENRRHAMLLIEQFVDNPLTTSDFHGIRWSTEQGWSEPEIICSGCEPFSARAVINDDGRPSLFFSKGSTFYIVSSPGPGQPFGQPAELPPLQGALSDPFQNYDRQFHLLPGGGALAYLNFQINQPGSTTKTQAVAYHIPVSSPPKLILIDEEPRRVHGSDSVAVLPSSEVVFARTLDSEDSPLEITRLKPDGAISRETRFKFAFYPELKALEDGSLMLSLDLQKSNEFTGYHGWITQRIAPDGSWDAPWQLDEATRFPRMVTNRDGGMVTVFTIGKQTFASVYR